MLESANGTFFLVIGRRLRGHDSGNEELRAVGVLAGVRHGELARPGVLELEVLVRELVAVDYPIPTLAFAPLMHD